MTIDVSFDFRTDANGKDPDTYSPTLQRYHHLLWSKPLPSRGQFELTPTRETPYALTHASALGEFWLTSDTSLPTFTSYVAMEAIVRRLPSDRIEYLNTITYSIGAMVLWPGNQIDRKWTINQARGCVASIRDRLDLTVECIRRHYQGDDTHPLADVFGRYRDFFDLFDDFAGYVDFWLLDDLVDSHGRVKVFLPSEDFTRPSLPQNLAEYQSFLERTIEFVTARNERIDRLDL